MGLDATGDAAGSLDSATTRRPLRIVVADDSVLLREGIVRLLTDDGHVVVAAVGDGEGLFEAALRYRPDLCIVDVRMPPHHTDEGLRAAIRIRSDLPGAPMLVLSQYVEVMYARELLASGSGAVGYLLKDRVSRIDEFLEVVVQVAGGATVLDPHVVAELVSARQRETSLLALTARERELLALVAEGHSNAAIAGRLVVSASAVEKHIGSIFLKLGLAADHSQHRRVLAVLAYLGM